MERDTTGECFSALSLSVTDKVHGLSSTWFPGPFKYTHLIAQLFPRATKEGRYEQPTTN